MAGFDDLVPECMPYAMTETLAATAGSSWEWTYELKDGTGVLVAVTGLTGVCNLRATQGGTIGVSPTVTFPSAGVVQCAVTPSASAAVAPGVYFHEVEVTNAAARKIMIVGGGDSRFTVKPGD